jgi:serine/threonine protein phosphatase PrpC
MEAVVQVERVQASRTKSGDTRYVLRDDQGCEYTTFEEDIARRAVAAEGRRARIEYHETERNGVTNVYLDAVEALEEAAGQASEVDEVA